MDTRYTVNAGAFLLMLALAGCGGSGGDGNASDSAAAGGGTTMAPTVWTSDGRALNSCSFNPICSGNPHAPFVVRNDPAPPDGSVLSGFVRLQARGIDIANAELLPGSGYTPRLGIYGLSRDKTTGWLDLDTRRLPNGPVTVRMSAFSMAAGQPGAVEMIGMPARTWIIDNPPLPAGFAATLQSAPANGAGVSGIVRLELRGNGIANAELLPASGYAPRHGQFNISDDRTHAWLDFDTRALPDGAADLRISAFSVTPGQENGSETVAMAPRRWNIANGRNGAFTAHATTAPMHGARVTGRVTIEVRGSGIRNVELLRTGSGQPPIGDFVESYDGSFAYLDLDTRSLPNGPLEVQVSAFNTAPGQAGAQEIVVLPTRRWQVQN